MNEQNAARVNRMVAETKRRGGYPIEFRAVEGAEFTWQVVVPGGKTLGWGDHATKHDVVLGTLRAYEQTWSEYDMVDEVDVWHTDLVFSWGRGSATADMSTDQANPFEVLSDMVQTAYNRSELD